MNQDRGFILCSVIILHYPLEKNKEILGEVICPMAFFYLSLQKNQILATCNKLRCFASWGGYVNGNKSESGRTVKLCLLDAELTICTLY